MIKVIIMDLTLLIKNLLYFSKKEIKKKSLVTQVISTFDVFNGDI